MTGYPIGKPPFSAPRRAVLAGHGDDLCVTGEHHVALDPLILPVPGETEVVSEGSHSRVQHVVDQRDRQMLSVELDVACLGGDAARCSTVTNSRRSVHLSAPGTRNAAGGAPNERPTNGPPLTRL
jgi:hypothetical protein